MCMKVQQFVLIANYNRRHKGVFNNLFICFLHRLLDTLRSKCMPHPETQLLVPAKFSARDHECATLLTKEKLSNQFRNTKYNYFRLSSLDDKTYKIEMDEWVSTHMLNCNENLDQEEVKAQMQQILAYNMQDVDLSAVSKISPF